MADRADILVTGAGGFIGRRLTRELVRRGHAVRALYRREPNGDLAGVEVVRGDLHRPETLPAVLDGIGTVYYLVHSLAAGHDSFRELDRQAAENFVAAADLAGTRRVIYLSGLGRPHPELSAHLDSRAEVGEILASGRFATTTLRAAIILGAGGASFELLRYLVKTQPLLLDAPELATRCQPIGVDDVIGYLAGCLAEERTAGATFDIGGPGVLSYRELLERIARIAGTANLFLPTPRMPAGLVGRWVGLFSRQRSSVVTALVEGLGNEVVCGEERLRELIPLRPTPLDAAIRAALEETAP